MSVMNTAIPYTVEARPETGLYNAKLGMWLFLASEVMLFGGLFSAYVFLRMAAAHWPAGSSILSIPLGAVNTVVLITSSITMSLASAAVKERKFDQFKVNLGLTILLALVFLSVKSFEYGMKFSHHMYPKTNTFLAIYFALTGVHVLHVLGGLVVNAYFWGPGSRMGQADPQRFANRIEIAGLYWNFVDVVWILLFVTLYLL